MFSLENRSKEKRSLVIILESGMVRGGVVAHVAGEVPKILYETLRTYRTPNNYSVLMSNLLQALESVCADITKEIISGLLAKKQKKGGTIDSIQFFYGAPWSVIRSKNIVITHDKKTTYTESFLERTYAAQRAASFSDTPGVVLIETWKDGWSVDGYAVQSPVNTPGNRLTFNLSAGGIPEGLKHRVEEVTTRSFHASSITHHSLALAAGQTIITQTSKIPLLFVDVSECITEISLIKEKGMVEALTFPYDGAHIRGSWRAQSGRLDHEAHQGISLNKTHGSAWEGQCVVGIAQLRVDQKLPQHIVLNAPPGMERFLQESIETIFSEKYRHSIGVQLLTAGGCTVTSVGTRDSSLLCLVALHGALDT